MLPQKTILIMLILGEGKPILVLVVYLAHSVSCFASTEFNPLWVAEEN